MSEDNKTTNLSDETEEQAAWRDLQAVISARSGTSRHATLQRDEEEDDYPERFALTPEPPAVDEEDDNDEEDNDDKNDDDDYPERFALTPEPSSGDEEDDEDDDDYYPERLALTPDSRSPRGRRSA